MNRETLLNEQDALMAEIKRRVSPTDFGFVLRLLELEYQLAVLEEHAEAE